jgi:hypothetical protein
MDRCVETGDFIGRLRDASPMPMVLNTALLLVETT